MRRFDILVVGAGIVGSAVARECARTGLRVGVIEAGVPAGGATGAAMGHVVVMDGSPAQVAMTAYSRALWREERDGMSDSVEYDRRGTLWVAADAEEMAGVEGMRRAFEGAEIEARMLTAREVEAEEPNLRRGLAGGLLVAGDAVVDPAAAAGFYLAEARRLGAELVTGRAVAAGKGRVELSRGEVLEAERIVLAVGVDCALLPQLPIERRKGHLVMTDEYPGFVRHQVVELGYLKKAHEGRGDSVAFNIQPRRNGQMVVGSSRQYGSEAAGVEEEVLRRMLARAEEYMPGLEGLRIVHAWTGFRAATEDKLPLIGPAAGLLEDASLWLAVGFEGLGITCAPGAARLLVDGMLGRETGIDAVPYLPARMRKASAMEEMG